MAGKKSALELEIENRVLREMLERKRQDGPSEPEAPAKPQRRAARRSSEIKAIRAARPPATRQEEPDWKKEWSRCPHCEKEGMVEPMFGTRLKDGIRYKHSWCHVCRAKAAEESSARRKVDRRRRGQRTP
jgi:hypothetical protein